MKNSNTSAHSPTTNVLFDQAAEVWLSAISEVRKRSTYVRYADIYRGRIKPYLGNICLKDLDTKMIHDCIMKERTPEDKPSAAFVHDTLNVILQIVQFSDPDLSCDKLVRGIILPKKETPRITTFTREEQRRLITVLMNEMDSYKLGIFICLNTGIRLGEICALKTEDIDCFNHQIHVSYTVQRLRTADSLKTDLSDQADMPKTMLVVSQPKTQNSDRVVPIADYVFSVIKEHFPCGEYFLNGDCLMEPRSYEYKYKKYLETAKIPYKKFHTLRHTFATNCIASGANPKVVSEILGHANVNITLNRYVHPTQELKREQMNQMVTHLNLY